MNENTESSAVTMLTNGAGHDLIEDCLQASLRVREAGGKAYEIQRLWTLETGIGGLPSPVFLRRLTCRNPCDFDR